jgi:hypothetical protein
MGFVGRQAATFNKGAVGAADIHNHNPFRAGMELGVATRDPLVTQHQVVAQRPSGSHRDFSQHDASFNHAVATDDQARSWRKPDEGRTAARFRRLLI